MKTTPPPPRREFVRALLAGTALAPWSALSLAGSAPAGDDARLVLVILRGGLDGLAAVPVPADPQFVAARGPLAQYASPPLPLDAGFALHPALVELNALYRKQELLVTHAIGLPYRERSHFDAQQLLESGGLKPYELSTGWLGRALAASGRKGLAVQTAVPLVLRGPGEIDTWAPSFLPDPSADLVARVERLYADDPALAQALARARGLRETGEAMPGRDESAMATPGGARAQAVLLARRAGEFLLRPGGPQAAVLELGGWDTHANQAWWWCSPNSAARWRSTAPRAPTMAAAARRSCSAARYRVAACGPTGPAWHRRTASRAATCARRPMCGRC